MTIALPKGYFLVTAGFAAIAGAGVASSFTVFDNASTWYLVLVAVITLGVYPLIAGWLSPPLRNVALFPISVLVGLSVAVRRQNKWDKRGAFKACNLDANRLRQFSDLPTSVRLDSFASPPVSSPVWRLAVRGTYPPA